MTNKHTKCPRCKRRGIRWGGNRRRCTPCGATWRVRKKKRGRKALRRTPNRAIKYMANREAVHLRNAKFYRRIISRNALMEQLPWPQVSQSGSVILIADAFLQYIERAWHTWYCILARPIDSEDAVILKPFCRRGTEVALGWQEAFAVVPNELLCRVKALVCDGHNGLILEARRRGWLIQRCHFHLVARLQQKRSRWIRGLHQGEGKQIYKLVKKALDTRSSKVLHRSLKGLAVLGRRTASRDIRRMTSGFLANYEDYRTYLHHTELLLPTTSNTAEAFVGLIRELCRRARGFRTVNTMDQWIEALVKARKTIKCRAKTNRII